MSFTPRPPPLDGRSQKIEPVSAARPDHLQFPVRASSPGPLLLASLTSLAAMGGLGFLYLPELLGEPGAAPRAARAPVEAPPAQASAMSPAAIPAPTAERPDKVAALQAEIAALLMQADRIDATLARIQSGIEASAAQPEEEADSPVAEADDLLRQVSLLAAGIPPAPPPPPLEGASGALQAPPPVGTPALDGPRPSRLALAAASGAPMLRQSPGDAGAVLHDVVAEPLPPPAAFLPAGEVTPGAPSAAAGDAVLAQADGGAEPAFRPPNPASTQPGPKEVPPTEPAATEPAAVEPAATEPAAIEPRTAQPEAAAPAAAPQEERVDPAAAEAVVPPSQPARAAAASSDKATTSPQPDLPPPEPRPAEAAAMAMPPATSAATRDGAGPDATSVQARPETPLASAPRLESPAALPAAAAGRDAAAQSALAPPEHGAGQAVALPAAASGPGPAAPQENAAAALSPEAQAAILQRAEEKLALGEVAAARTLYREAAQGGSSKAAAALGRTYQEDFLRGIGALGVAADPLLAAVWARRAEALAASEPPRAAPQQGEPSAAPAPATPMPAAPSAASPPPAAAEAAVPAPVPSGAGSGPPGSAVPQAAAEKPSAPSPSPAPSVEPAAAPPRPAAGEARPPAPPEPAATAPPQGPAAAPLPQRATAPSAAPEQAGPSPPAPPIAPAELEAVIRRADAMLALRDISAARLLYAYAAQGGSGRAAAALGRTYDPAFLEGIGAQGIRPDPVQAAQWYRKAVALGEAQAAAALSRLERR